MTVNVDINEPGTLVDVLRLRASEHPNQLALRFLVDGEHDELTVSNLALHERAQAIGYALGRVGKVGDRVLLLYPPGLDFVAAFFGCLYAGLVAVPTYPPYPTRLKRTLPRLRSILENAAPVVVLTTNAIQEMMQSLLQPDDLPQVDWLATDEIALGKDVTEPSPQIDGTTIAFLQYTSGSTGSPRGVELAHSNILHNSQMLRTCLRHSPDSEGVTWLPPYHDMGLIGAILHPLHVGFPCTMMSPLAFLQRPIRWLEAISRFSASTSTAPNFAYDLCVQKVNDADIGHLDLSSWRVALNGAEPIRPETLDAFANKFRTCGFRREAFFPCYGLAEATLIVTGGIVEDLPKTIWVDVEAIQQGRFVEVPPDAKGAHKLVNCGSSLADQRILIVEPESRLPVPPDQIGEIWVSGPSVARGYWNQQGLADATFQARLADSGEGPFLRTGDLGFLCNGCLFVTGRLKDLIVVRGRKVHPEDIERTIDSAHPMLRPNSAAVFANELNGTSELVILQEIMPNVSATEVKAAVHAMARAVAEEYDLAASIVLVKPGAIFRTSSGKIQRYLCREAFAKGALDVVAEQRVRMSVAG